MKVIIVFQMKKKKKKWQYGCERYKNQPENELQKLVEYRKVKRKKKSVFL